MANGSFHYFDVFGPGSNLNVRIVRDYEEIERRAQAIRTLDLKIALTSGSFDLYHEGHARYLEQAKRAGHVVIVGVDNDEKVHTKKGKRRPIVADLERMEILCHCRHVDLVFLKRLGDAKWELIRRVHPDVLIATEGTYTDDDLRALKEFCGEVRVMPPQAATSTTARVRKLLFTPVDEIHTKLSDVMRFIEELRG